MTILDQISTFLDRVSTLGLFGYILLFVIGFLYLNRITVNSNINRKILESLDGIIADQLEINRKINSLISSQDELELLVNKRIADLEAQLATLLKNNKP